MGFGQHAPRIVMVLNTLTMIMGIVMLAGAIYVWTKPEYASLLPAYSVWVAGAAGILIFIVSLLGCFSVYKNYRKLMVLYTLLVLCVLCIQIAGAYLYSEYITLVRNGSLASFDPKNLVDPNAISLNNAILSVYTACCSGCLGFCSGPYKASAPDKTDYCPTKVIIIVPVPTCSIPVGCSDLFEQATCMKPVPPATNYSLPSFNVDPAICTNLAITRVNSTTTATFVGLQAQGSCGEGSPRTFQNQVYTYASSMLVWVLGIASFVAALEFLLLFASIAALCANKERKN